MAVKSLPYGSKQFNKEGKPMFKDIIELDKQVFIYKDPELLQSVMNESVTEEYDLP